MHSSSPRKEERILYRPAARGSIQTWIARVLRQLQNSPRLVVTLILALLLFSWVYLGRGSGGRVAIAGTFPSVVMVAVLDMTGESGEVRVIDNVLENRVEYARAHGYEFAVYNATDFRSYSEAERVWTKLAALRDAMNEYPHVEWFWYLDQNAIIMNPSIPIHTHYLSPASLLVLPLRESPVFPPHSATRTLSLRAQPISQIGLILCHGSGILHTGSVILRRGDYAKFVVDSWNDPLVRSYGFPGEDSQAIEHLIQFHPTILEGLAIMPKRSLLSFGVAAGEDEQFHEGDFVVHLDGCQEQGRSCEKEFMRYWAQRGSITVENEQVPPQNNKVAK